MQTAAKVAGLLFLAVGVLGFVPGAPLAQLGLSLLPNVVHVGFGVTGLFAARAPTKAQSYLIVGGGLYGSFVLVGCVLAYAIKSAIPVDGVGGCVQLVAVAVMITLGLGLRHASTGVGTGLAGPSRSTRERPSR